MLDSVSESAYEQIFSVDMVYGAQCWKLCGDGHCCHFSRYRRADESPVQEFPLFDGEYDFMASRGLLSQYASYDSHIWDVDLSVGQYRFQTLRVPTLGSCPCEHSLRPTVCRLYPLLPKFELGKGVTAFDDCFTMYEEAEKLAGIPRACQIRSVNTTEINKLMRIASALYEAPRCLFSVMAYALQKKHVLARVVSHMAFQGQPVHRALFELEQSENLIDKDTLSDELDALAGDFAAYFGPAFSLS